MNELDKKLIAEDIPELTRGGEPNILREFAEKFGVEPLIWLSEKVWVEEKYSSKIHIPDYRTLKRFAYSTSNTPDQLP